MKFTSTARERKNNNLPCNLLCRSGLGWPGQKLFFYNPESPLNLGQTQVISHGECCTSFLQDFTWIYYGLKVFNS